MLEGDSCCFAYCTGRFNQQCMFFVARAIFGGVWRVARVALRIIVDLSCVTSINHQCHVSWQLEFGEVGVSLFVGAVSGVNLGDIPRKMRTIQP